METLNGLVGRRGRLFAVLAAIVSSQTSGMITVDTQAQQVGLPPIMGGAVVSRGDFNGDGFVDLALGAPGEDRLLTRLVWNGLTFDKTTRDVPDAGVVHVIFGSANGLTAAGNRLIDQGQGRNDNDRFGAALAAGDFNGDGFVDLAVAAPGERDSNGVASGAIQVFPGSATGPGTAQPLVFTSAFTIPAGGPDLPIVMQPNVSLVAADFTGDGVDDLVFEGVVRSTCSTHIMLLRGATGDALSTNRSQFFEHDTGCDLGTRLTNVSLAAGDFDLDGDADLVVGSPHQGRSPSAEFTSLALNIGVVDVFRGGSAGISVNASRRISQFSPGPTGPHPETTAEAGDAFGAAVATGDFNGDGRIDIAVGVPGESIGNGPERAGAVQVFVQSGTQSSFVFSSSQLITQNAAGADVAEDGDVFGAVLVAADFNGNGITDLAVGAPGETLFDRAAAGAVSVMYGTSTGFFRTATASQPAALFLHEDVTGFSSSTAADDRFGAALTAGDFDGAGGADLVIGVPFDSVTVRTANGTLVSVPDAGAAHAIYSVPVEGLALPGLQFWSQASPDILEDPETGDQFGHSAQ